MSYDGLLKRGHRTRVSVWSSFLHVIEWRRSEPIEVFRVQCAIKTSVINPEPVLTKTQLGERHCMKFKV